MRLRRLRKWNRYASASIHSLLRVPNLAIKQTTPTCFAAHTHPSSMIISFPQHLAQPATSATTTQRHGNPVRTGYLRETFAPRGNAPSCTRYTTLYYAILRYRPFTLIRDVIVTSMFPSYFPFFCFLFLPDLRRLPAPASP